MGLSVVIVILLEYIGGVSVIIIKLSHRQSYLQKGNKRYENDRTNGNLNGRLLEMEDRHDFKC